MDQDRLHYRIELPYPVSANRLWRSTGKILYGKGGRIISAAHFHCSREYTSWIKEADSLYLTQKRDLAPVRTLGAYTLHCVFSAAKRRPTADGDNLTKCVHDWLQRVAVIRNDCLCEGGSWRWGDAPSGCVAIVEAASEA